MSHDYSQNHYGTSDTEIESLRQQLTDSQKQVVMLRDALDYAARTYDSVWTKGMPIICGMVEEALAATDGLDGLILCEKKPVAYTAADFCDDGIPLYRAWEPR